MHGVAVTTKKLRPPLFFSPPATTQWARPSMLRVTVADASGGVLASALNASGGGGSGDDAGARAQLSLAPEVAQYIW